MNGLKKPSEIFEKKTLLGQREAAKVSKKPTLDWPNVPDFLEVAQKRPFSVTLEMMPNGLYKPRCTFFMLPGKTKAA